MVVLVDDDLNFSLRIEKLFAEHEIPLKRWVNYNNLKERLMQERPNVILLDIEIGNEREAGLIALERIKENYPYIKTIVLTAHRQHIVKAFRLGANGYLDKRNIRNHIELIQDAIREVESGSIAMTKDVRRALVRNLQPLDRGMINSLNDREKQILLLSAFDKNAPQIAKELKLKPKTVETYLKYLRTKFECHTIQGVVGKAFLYRILLPDDLLPESRT